MNCSSTSTSTPMSWLAAVLSTISHAAFLVLASLALACPGARRPGHRSSGHPRCGLVVVAVLLQHLPFIVVLAAVVFQVGRDKAAASPLADVLHVHDHAHHHSDLNELASRHACRPCLDATQARHRRPRKRVTREDGRRHCRRRWPVWNCQYPPPRVLAADRVFNLVWFSTPELVCCFTIPSRSPGQSCCFLVVTSLHVAFLVLAVLAVDVGVISLSIPSTDCELVKSWKANPGKPYRLGKTRLTVSHRRTN